MIKRIVCISEERRFGGTARRVLTLRRRSVGFAIAHTHQATSPGETADSLTSLATANSVTITPQQFTGR